MKNFVFIGTGAAGNKALATTIDMGVAEVENSLFLNTTTVDVPAKYKPNTVTLGNQLRGCGKERSVSMSITETELNSGKLPIADLLQDSNIYTAIIVTSIGGGTGSGSAVVLANYIKEELGKSVLLVGFKGFGIDTRELRNDIEFFQDLNKNIAVQIIDNTKFLDEARGNYKNAEELANIEFANRMRIFMGSDLVESGQNIDDTDLFKLVAGTPRYMTIDSADLAGIKNQQQFDDLINAMYDTTKSLDFTASCGRLGIILNCSQDKVKFIDQSFNVIKERTGFPYETFLHIQNEGTNEYIAVIAAGLKLPTKEVIAIQKQYQDAASKNNNEDDDFFATVAGMQGNALDSRFDMNFLNRK